MLKKSSIVSNLYCAQLWWIYPHSIINKIWVAYNNGFRKLMNLDRRCSASGMWVAYNIDSFDVLRRKNIFSIQKRIYESSNTLLNTIGNYFVLKSSAHAEWCKSLYLP